MDEEGNGSPLPAEGFRSASESRHPSIRSRECGCSCRGGPGEPTVTDYPPTLLKTNDVRKPNAVMIPA